MARSTGRRAALIAAALMTCAVAVTGATHATPAAAANGSCPWLGSGAPIEQRVAQVLSRMTLDEKITMVHGAATAVYSGFVPGDARLCIPALNLQDGPVGVRLNDTTQLPSAADLAASFDPALAKSYGTVIGAEDKTKGVSVDLGPTINIVRDPRWGRAFESYSEDPYLAGQIGAGDINGVQSQDVLAQVKHWAVYNQETNRNTPADNAIVADRTVREIYAAAFQTVIDGAQPSSAMCSYSIVNGIYACENAYLDKILKNDFGFTGFITSDWYATHSTVNSANAGLDMQMPDDTYFGAALKQAIQDGRVAQSRLDDMVTRIMREEFRFGLFDHPSAGNPDAIASTPAHVAVAKKAAEDGTVLLKNAGNLLPLDTHKVHSIAVIGDGAGLNTMSAGGGSATVVGTGTVTPYDGIKARAGSGVTVTYAQGNLPSNGSGGRLPTIDSTYFTPPSGTGHGLQGNYYANKTLLGTPAATQIDPRVAFTWNGAAPAPGLPGTNFSAKWTATLAPPVTGTYTFGLTSDDGSRLFINGHQVIDNWRDQAPNLETAQVSLTAGTPVQVEVDYYQGGGGDMVNLGWVLPGNVVDQAVGLAAKSDVAIVYANNFESEGGDLANIDLSSDQNQLIQAVAAANPNTIVVLNTGSAVTMPWLAQVKGVFEAWYPGQQAGNAIAALLFGDVNPSGRLPVTFPTSLAQVPASTAAQWPGVNGQVQYSEGINVGYRWYDAKNLTPLFPFGYGLSYTSFRFSNLHVDGSTLRENGRIQASVDITNTGRSKGAEVAQLYLSDPASTGEPANQLRGFQKVDLKPGQTKKLTFEISAKAASYWNSEAQAWTLGTGTYTVHVGDSSRNLPLSDTFRVDRTTGPRYTKVTAPAVASPGSTLSVTTAFTNGATEPVSGAVTTLTVPASWTATAQTPTSFGLVAPGQTVSTTWSVAVPANAPGGAWTLTAATRYRGSEGLPLGAGSAIVEVVYASLSATYNNPGISDNSNPTAGNFDGSGFSFSAQGLAKAGLAQGATVNHDGLRFTWPNVPPGQPDNTVTGGQVIAASGRGAKIGILGAGAGDQSGTIVIVYTDGSTQQAPLRFADWYSDVAAPGGDIVATAPWNVPPSNPFNPGHPVSVYYAGIPLSAGKTLKWVILPTNAGLHIFAMAVGGKAR